MAWITKDSDESYAQMQEPPREYTKKEKAENWWHYNKWAVIIGAVVVVGAAFIVKDTLLQTKPDYEVAYVGLAELPVDTSESLAAALAQFGEDLNGDGQVVVQLNQYALSFDADSSDTDAYTQMAGVTKLSADISDKDGSYIFILEDPESFENNTGVLQYLDGTLPAGALEGEDDPDYDWENMVYRWADCPVLAALELGDYAGYTLLDDVTGSNQSVLENYYIARRGYADAETEAAHSADTAMWQALTEGAQKLPQAEK